MDKRLRASLIGLAAGIVLNVVFSALDYFLRIRNLCESLSASPVGSNCPESAISYVLSGMNPFSSAVFWVSILIGLAAAYIYFYRL